MLLLVAGMAVFVGAHLVPSVPRFRESLIDRFGFNRYRGLFSLASLAGFVMIIFGMGAAPMVPLWEPPSWGFTATVLGMPFAFILLAAAYVPSNVKRVTRHPMLWAVTLWAGLHLLSNGDLASLILFGGFAAFALFDMVSANRRGAELSQTAVAWPRDLIPIALGLAAYALFLYYHQTLFGRSVLPYWQALWS
jgi:uncharacterized membrane protein